ncbi:hypothetical protein NADFUDRAFT_53519 [Nadsonia fulvescens var. elongata DSM 6958]|uniref:CAP-Gly domain-containing protein n=1 Tax=Nadsonia fulvescens var. elongata DSM 6958 TaxID=857566 RepID=A0A1E3PCW1_9ASCO|nr:hypothetical protein NADFUDRAFT_53519 [Nadsonia fulvescens var. elongata DSM 6958]
MPDVALFVTSDQTSSERRVNPEWTLDQLKTKLEQITGIAPPRQKLLIYGSSSATQAVTMCDPSVPIAEQPNINLEGPISQFPLVPYGRIHVVDVRAGEEDDSLNTNGEDFERFVLSDKNYEQRAESALQWKKRNQLGRFAPDATPKDNDSVNNELATLWSSRTGQRCRTIGVDERRGTIRYVGAVPEITDSGSIWIGVEFDEPQGKNDGSIKGRSYFRAKPLHGSFLKPEVLEVGDFPELDLFSDDEI